MSAAEIGPYVDAGALVLALACAFAFGYLHRAAP